MRDISGSRSDVRLPPTLMNLVAILKDLFRFEGGVVEGNSVPQCAKTCVVASRKVTDCAESPPVMIYEFTVLLGRFSTMQVSL